MEQLGERHNQISQPHQHFGRHFSLAAIPHQKTQLEIVPYRRYITCVVLSSKMTLHENHQETKSFLNGTLIVASKGIIHPSCKWTNPSLDTALTGANYST